MKFSALKVNFNGLSLDFLCSWKPAQEGIKEQYPCKSRYFNAVGESFMKAVAEAWACYLSQQAVVTSFLVVSTSMTLKNPNSQNKGLY